MPEADNAAFGSEAAVAEYLGVPLDTAQARRLNGHDWPPAYQFGAKVMYRWEEVKAWAEANDSKKRSKEITVDVLKVDDTARLLGVGRNTIYELVGRNAIPHRRIGKHIRFSRAALMKWLEGNPVVPR